MKRQNRPRKENEDESLEFLQSPQKGATIFTSYKDEGEAWEDGLVSDEEEDPKIAIVSMDGRVESTISGPK